MDDPQGRFWSPPLEMLGDTKVFIYILQMAETRIRLLGPKSSCLQTHSVPSTPRAGEIDLSASADLLSFAQSSK